MFDQGTGDFTLNGEITNDAFLTRLVSKVNTAGNDFGPYRLYSALDGFEYLILSSVSNGNLDFSIRKTGPILELQLKYQILFPSAFSIQPRMMHTSALTLIRIQPIFHQIPKAILISACIQNQRERLWMPG
jgi:hypothetical protein